MSLYRGADKSLARPTNSEACQGRARFQQHRDASRHQVFFCKARHRRKFTPFWQKHNLFSPPGRAKDLSVPLYYYYYYFLWCSGPTRAMASSFLRFLDHTQRRITVGRSSLDERPLPDNTQLSTTDKHPCPLWDSNPWSQQAIGRRLTP